MPEINLAFIDEPGEGQTEQHDELRLHLLSAHCNLAALGHTDAEAIAEHEHEHRGPCTIRNHDQDATFWDHNKILAMLIEQDRSDFLVEGDKNELGRQVAAHRDRVSRHFLAAKPVPIHERVSRYTISILPADNPRRRHYQINVTEDPPAGDRWYVEHLGYWADHDGNWEPISGAGAATHKFPRDKALNLARRLAPTIEGGNGKTALDVLNMPKEGRRG